MAERRIILANSGIINRISTMALITESTAFKKIRSLQIFSVCREGNLIVIWQVNELLDFTQWVLAIQFFNILPPSYTEFYLQVSCHHGLSRTGATHELGDANLIGALYGISMRVPTMHRSKYPMKTVETLRETCIHVSIQRKIQRLDEKHG